MPLSQIKMTESLMNIVKHCAVSFWKLTNHQGQVIFCLFSKPSSYISLCSNITDCSRHTAQGLMVMIAVQCVFVSVCMHLCVCLCAHIFLRHLLQVSDTCCGIKELALTNNHTHTPIHALDCMQSSHHITPHNYSLQTTVLIHTCFFRWSFVNSRYIPLFFLLLCSPTSVGDSERKGISVTVKVAIMLVKIR